jgi:hypothetical protein
MRKIRRGWALSKKSWALLREHPAQLRFPLYGGVLTILCAPIVFGPGLLLIDDEQTAVGLGVVAIGIYLLATIGLFFSVALAASAGLIFRGHEASVSDGVALARECLPQIAGWAALSTTVGILLSVLEDEGGIFGQIFGRLLAVGWSLATFLAPPVIAFEGTGPIETLKRSGSLFKSRWGEQVTGNVAIGGGIALLGTLPAIFLIVMGLSIWSSSGFAGALCVVVGVVVLAVALLLSAALKGIFGVALYRYALEGEAVGGFTPEEFDSAVKRRRGRGGDAPPTATPGTV